ncbi:uncharacterized protein A1O9_13167, partial [Exophiala aquamarina CBS 119918]
RFARVDEQFERVDARFRELTQSFIAQTTNSRAASPRHQILPLGVTDPSSPSELLFPPPSLHFPGTVMHFWDLQEDRNIRKLVALCNFYRITREEIVGDLTNLSVFEDVEDTSPSSSASSSEEALRVLQKTVMESRQGALSCLANRLHLNFESISYNVGPVLQLREEAARREERGVKRAAGSEKGFARIGGLDNKRMLRDNTSASEHSPTNRHSGNRERDNGHAPLTQRVKDYLVPQEELMWRQSPESARTKLGYAKDSQLTPERRKIRDPSHYQETAPELESIKSEPNLGRQSKENTEKVIRFSPSPGSTVPFSHTPTPVKEAEERRREKQGSPFSIA